MTLPSFAPGIEILAPITAEYEQIATPDAISFVAKLHRAFENRRQELLARRQARQAALDAGERPDFLPETRHIREGDFGRFAHSLPLGISGRSC